MNLLDVEDLHCGYGSDEIIHGIDFNVGPGEIVTILGPNGSGKTTFVKGILGFVRVTRGSVTFQGRDITQLKPTVTISLGIGYAPQLLNVFKPLTVRENLEMGGYSLNRAELDANMGRLFELFPVLRERSTQKAATLSGGERQLLAMARAMMVQPSLMFLDEPSAGLSPVRASELFSQVRTIAELGTSVVIVEQDVERALEISSRGYVFVMGRAAFEGPAESIVADERIRTAYLGVRETPPPM